MSAASAVRATDPRRGAVSVDWEACRRPEKAGCILKKSAAVLVCSIVQTAVTVLECD